MVKFTAITADMGKTSKNHIGIVGLGLIGGSIAEALRDEYDVIGFDTDSATCEYAKNHGICRTVADLSAMRGCSVIFVCVPVSATERVLESVYGAVGESAIISDVASVKTPFSHAKGRYVGGHPMAGTELGGIQAAKPHLFQNAYWCITGSGADADTVRSIVKAFGAIPVDISAEEHDRAVSKYSHAPHAIAYALAAAAITGDAAPIAGSGFLDTTRIAKSDAGFWSDVLYLNRQNVIEDIRAVTAQLQKIETMLNSDDRAALIEYLDAARKKRLALDRIDLGGATVYVDLVDRVGEFERVTGVVARAGINVKSIALVPGREGTAGALRLEFENESDAQAAKTALGIKEKSK